ncbi:MAG: hypothetical protein PHT75_01210 [Bacilli bacterium]|nr:hypothetical protein [Bacilli bacterium]MDD3304734.1 hypothetical protein [Bacilli bacterium]MDD4053587.1 hypothetical protein [Bacilli bacterium]MDD4411086.1 hypothetical protein [Bacilli bacterium]
MRKSIQFILIAIIVAVSGHIFVSNVEHVIYLNTKTYNYNFEGTSSIETIKSSIQNIENNIIKIEKLESSYLSEKELNEIKDFLKQNLEIAKELPFTTYDSIDITLSEKDFYKDIKASTNLGISGLVRSYSTLAKYNEDLDVNNFTQNSLMQLLYVDFIGKEIRENYKYPTSIDYNMSVNMKPLALVNSVVVKLNTIEYISELVLESGDIYE